MGYYLITCSANILEKKPVSIGIEATSEQAALNQYADNYLECHQADHLIIECKIRDILEDTDVTYDERINKLCKLFEKVRPIQVVDYSTKGD